MSTREHTHDMHTAAPRRRGTRAARIRLAVVAALAFSAVTIGLAAAPDAPEADAQAIATYPSHDVVVSADPVPWTPHILDGAVKDIAQVGDTMIVGGDFTQVAPPQGSPIIPQPNVFAFDATDGTISSTFTPSAGGEILAVEAGPIPGTVYIAGGSGGVNGQNGRVFLVNVSDGTLVPGFDDPPLNGRINDLVLIDGTLYAGGTFTIAAGLPYGGLIALDPLTGAIDPKLNVILTENHSWTPGSNSGRAPVGAFSIDVDPAATTLAVVGNFREADGLDRRQMVLIDLTQNPAVVRPDWRTLRYYPTCSRRTDTYMRDVTFSPDGAYVHVATTGGPNPGTLCDTATQWDVGESDLEAEPMWLDDTGGDTLLSIASSGSAVYTGGHQRWMNNPGGRDRAVAGAVPRPGIAAMDTENGVPLSWNPGRNPRGVGAEVVEVTDAGLWVGSDTDFIGYFQLRRPRLAFFPVEGGTDRGAEAATAVPANVYLSGSLPTNDGTTSLYRVNAGGPELAALDGEIAWISDADAAQYRSFGDQTSSYSDLSAGSTSVPPETPTEVFSTIRWDTGAAGDGQEMSWSFPVTAGTEVDVRLYLGERTNGYGPGQRVFDVSIDGALVRDDFDMAATYGAQFGSFEQFNITSDGVVDIEFGHVVNNPTVAAIEIREVTGVTPPAAPADLSRIWFQGAGVDPADLTAAPAGDIDWSTVTGAFMVDDSFYYATSTNDFLRRSFDGQTFGTVEVIDPYNDPFWSDKDAGRTLYRGVRPTFYSQTNALTGLAYLDSRLYSTRAGSGQIFVRDFAPESGIMAEATTTVTGFDIDGVGNIFFDPAAGLLYFVDLDDGSLFSIAFADDAVSGSSTLVSGPAVDGMDWRSENLFVGPGPAPTPTAAISTSCDMLTCDLSGSGSSDPDGTVVSWGWDLGDGSTTTGQNVTHTYAAAGTYTVTLTVTDDDGYTDTVTDDVTVADIAAPDAVGVSTNREWTMTPSVTVPSETQPGDLLVFFFSTNQNAQGTGPDGVGAWTDENRTVNGALATSVFTRIADGSEAGQDITMTLPSRFRSDLTVVAYRGATGIDDLAVATDQGTSIHTTPAVTSDGAARTEVSYWADRSSSTTGWTAPAGVDVLSTQIGTEAGRVTTLVADRTVDAGTHGGLTATTNAPASRAITIALTLTPGTATPPNQPPVAAIDSSCALLTCDLSGTGSTDPDGTIVSWDWDLGDGNTATGDTVNHAYAAAGTYTVTLTVTDDGGLTDTVTDDVTVANVTAPEAVGVAANREWTVTPSVTVPTTVQPGDLLLFFFSTNQNAQGTGPDGVGAWTEEQRVTNGPLATSVFSRIADGSEAGLDITMTLPSRFRSDLTVVAYRGTTGIDALSFTTDGSTATHTTPAVTSAGAARTEVSYWADRSSSTTGWTAPAGVDVLSTQIGTEAGRVTTLVADRTVDAGTHGGLTATTNAPASRAITIALTLTPA